MRRSLLETLESRRLLTNVLPAFAEQIGLVNLIDPNTTFEDNFEGTALNRDKWQVRQGPRWRKVPNGAISEMSVTGEESIVVRNGNLELIAHTDPATGQNRAGYIQTGSDFKAGQPDDIEPSRLMDGYNGSFEQAFGYWEARMKFTSLPGQWSAFWVHSYGMVDVGHDASRINHPEIYGTEYDVAEHGAIRQGAAVSNTISTVVHANGYENYQRSNAIHPTTSAYGPSFTNPSAFHVYGLLWTPTYVKFFVDGNLVHTETDAAMVSKVPHVAIFSNDIGAGGALYPNSGSNYFGNVPATGYGSLDMSSAKLTADYVRVWNLKDAASPTYGSLSGIVYSDANANGAREAGEAGLSGRTVYLDANWNNVLDAGERKAVTNASGEYVLNELAPGTYLVRQVLTTGTQTAPTTLANATVNIAANQRAALNFGVGGLNPVVGGVIEGRVIRDANSNGVFDDGEIGAAGVKVYLDYNQNQLRDDAEPQAVTGTLGGYRLESNRSGVSVRLNLVGSDFVQTFPGVNGDRWVTVPGGQAVNALPFGVKPRVVEPTYAIVTGNVYNDVNRNGRKDAGESGRANVVVYLDLNFNGRRDDTEPSKTTTATGLYRFEQVARGLVAVRIVAPSGLTQTQPTGGGSHWINAVAGVTYGDKHFGVYETPIGARIAGLVYLDANTNGRRDAGEAGGANIRVYLDTNFNARLDDGERNTLTSSTGAYVFEQVPAGNTSIRVALSNDYRQITPTANGSIWLTAFNAGNYVERQFGIARVAAPAATNTITGNVFTDWNRNGKRDANESGIGGFKVYLDYNLNGRYDAGEPLATTNASGVYRFEAVRAGNLAIRLNLAGVGWLQTYPTSGGALWHSFTSGMNLKDQNFLIRPK